MTQEGAEVISSWSLTVKSLHLSLSQGWLTDSASRTPSAAPGKPAHHWHFACQSEMTDLARRAYESPLIVIPPLPFFWDSPASVSPSPFWSDFWRISAEQMSLSGHPTSHTVLPFAQTAHYAADVPPLSRDGEREQ